MAAIQADSTMQADPAIQAALTRQHRKRWWAMSVLTSAVLISALDSSVMTVSTPTIQRSFGASLPELEWTTVIYTLVFGATMLIWGKLGDLYGQRLIFMAGIAVFATGSLLVGLSPSIEFMIAMRAFQALGAAMINPAAIALITLMFGATERPLAFGINGVSVNVGIALGYLVGGVCSEYFGWHWAFFVNLPLCALCIVGALRLIEPQLAPRRPLTLDWAGALLSLAALMLVMFGMIMGQTYGWWSVKQPLRVPLLQALPISVAPLALALGGALLATFVMLQLDRKRSGREPLLDLSLFALPSFRWSITTFFVRNIAFFGTVYSLTLYLQRVEGFSALNAGLAVLPIALAGTVSAPLGGKLAQLIGAQRAVLAGLVLQLAGLVWLWLLVAPRIGLTALVLPCVVLGAGFGVSFGQLTTATLQDVPRALVSGASAVSMTVKQMGFAFGAATVGIVLATTTTRLALEGFSATAQGVDGMRNNMLLNIVLTVICIAVALMIPNRTMRTG